MDSVSSSVAKWCISIGVDLWTGNVWYYGERTRLDYVWCFVFVDSSSYVAVDLVLVSESGLD